MLPVNQGGLGDVVLFVQHCLQAWWQGNAALFEPVCPAGSIKIAVLSEEAFGGGELGWVLSIAGIFGRW
ncbi:hypothetical protein A7Q02_00715 [Eikenella sp. NML97-A-109]|nr:hypothetical protein A7Q02_00715 [Eikenella sp. NML97-A-109]